MAFRGRSAEDSARKPRRYPCGTASPTLLTVGLPGQIPLRSYCQGYLYLWPYCDTDPASQICVPSVDYRSIHL